MPATLSSSKEEWNCAMTALRSAGADARRTPAMDRSELRWQAQNSIPTSRSTSTLVSICSQLQKEDTHHEIWCQRTRNWSIEYMSGILSDISSMTGLDAGQDAVLPESAEEDSLASDHIVALKALVRCIGTVFLFLTRVNNTPIMWPWQLSSSSAC